MFKSLLKVTSVVLVLTASANAVIITGFGTGQFSIISSEFPPATQSQTASAFTISGVGADDSLGFFGSIPAPVSIVGQPIIQLSLVVNATLTSNFSVELYDAADEVRVYDGNFAAFPVGVPTTVNLTFNNGLSSGLFDGSVTKVLFAANGTGAPLNVTFDTLQAVPEPTSLALLGLGGALAFRASRRRR